MGTKGTRIIVKGTPVAKQRPRFGNGHAYTPKDTIYQEKLIAWTYKAHNGPMMDGAIEIDCEFVYAPLKTWSKKKTERMMGQPKLTRPDTDNMVKLVLDALNGIAYTDDNRIWKITSRKVFGKEAMTIITIREAEEIG